MHYRSLILNTGLSSTFQCAYNWHTLCMRGPMPWQEEEEEEGEEEEEQEEEEKRQTRNSGRL